MNELNNDSSVSFGKATVPWDIVKGGWRLPSGKTTKNKDVAVNMAKRINNYMLGKHKVTM